MPSDYICLNAKTFDIELETDFVAVDKALANAISILNKKGYYTEMFSKTKISKPFLLGALIHELIENSLILKNDETKDLIKKIINQSDYESTLIIFKEEYNFENLPTGYKLFNNTNLAYDLNVLKETDNIELKTLVELDNEHTASIKALEEWVTNLPNRKVNN